MKSEGMNDYGTYLKRYCLSHMSVVFCRIGLYIISALRYILINWLKREKEMYINLEMWYG